MKYQELMTAAAEYIAEEKPRTDAPAQVTDLMRPLTQELEQEVFYVLMLDTKHSVTKIHEVTRGLVDRSQVHAREVFREAIRCNASRVILAHNHPSGDPTPSAQDISCTKNLTAAGKILGIQVLDHIVIGKKTESRPRDFLSLREENLLIQ